jgi:hypothetical protein
VGTKIRLVVAFFAVTALVTGCTTTVTGAAQQVPGQMPVKKAADPCTLLSPEQSQSLNLDPKGEFVAAEPARLAPQNCTWNQADPNADFAPLTVVWTEDLSLDVYNNGALPSEKSTLGRLEWTRYTGILGKSFCSLTTTLGPKSFVEVSSSNVGEPGKSCDLAKLAAPLVASHLPGGETSPTLPTASKAPVPSGPLASIQPCALLRPEQATSLKLAGTGIRIGGTTNPEVPPGCEWADTDGEGGQKPFDVFVGAVRPVKDWPGLATDGNPETFDAGGKHWTVYPDAPVCSATLSVTGTSSLKITSGQPDDPAKVCDLVKAAIPFLSGNIGN